MIHQYQNNGYNIVLDVNSGAVHVVDKSAYDVIACLEAMNSSHTVESLQSEETYRRLKETLGGSLSESDLQEVLEAVIELTESGAAFYGGHL